MGAPRAPYMAKTDKERLATGFWNRIESNQATDCNNYIRVTPSKAHNDQKSSPRPSHAPNFGIPHGKSHAF